VFFITGKLLFHKPFTFNRLLIPSISALTILFGNFALWLLNNGDWNLPSACSGDGDCSIRPIARLGDVGVWYPHIGRRQHYRLVSCTGMKPTSVFSTQTIFHSLSEYLNNAGYCHAAVPWNRPFPIHRNVQTSKQTPTQCVSGDFSPSETLHWPVHETNH